MGEAMNEAAERLADYCRWDARSDSVALQEYVADDGLTKDIRALLAERDALRKALEWFPKHQSTIAADLSSAHSGRADAASEWMREEDRELRQDWRTACDRARQALTGAPDHE